MKSVLENLSSVHLLLSAPGSSLSNLRGKTGKDATERAGDQSGAALLPTWRGAEGAPRLTKSG